MTCLLVVALAQPSVAGQQPTNRTHQPGVEVVDLGLSGGGIRVVDLTDSGVVVGTVVPVGEDESRPFRWEDGVVTELADLGGGGSFVQGANERGVSAGASTTGDGELHAVVWERDGDVVDLGAEGLTSFAVGISRRGVVAGLTQLTSSDPAMFPVLWRSGTMIVLDDLPGRSVDLVSDRGLVVGSGADPTTGLTETFVWDGRRTTVLDAPEGDHAFPLAVNRRNEVLVLLRSDATERRTFVLWAPGRAPRVLPVSPAFVGDLLTDRGEVVGGLYENGDTSRPLHAARLERDGTLTDLGTLGGATSFSVAVSERGHVLGFATDPDEVLHAVVWDEDGDVVDLGSGTYDVGPADIAGPTHLNRRGQIVGALTDADFIQHLTMWRVVGG